jgi:3-dehydroquinate synthetase
MAGRVGKRITHGECVAIGMVHALRLSQRYVGMESKTSIDEILAAKIIGSSGSIGEIIGDEQQIDNLREEFRTLLSSDKKSRFGADVSFVLLNAPGKIAKRDAQDYMIRFTFEDAWRDIKETFAFLKSQF